MKVIAILSAVVALGSCAPLDDSKNAEIVRYENEPYVHEGDGYKFYYETSDGQSRKEQGEFVGPDQSLSVQGSYAYTDSDGVAYEVVYVADDNGYRVTSHKQQENARPGFKKQEFEVPEPVVVALPPGAIASLVG